MSEIIIYTDPITELEENYTSQYLGTKRSITGSDYNIFVADFSVSADNADQTSDYALNNYLYDTTAPDIYFTGATPPDNYISTQDTFTGEVETIEANLRKLTWTRDATDYIFNISGYEHSFTTGEYSLTDYADTGLVLAINFDTSGDLQDYSINSNTFINSGATRTGQWNLNGAYYFDGEGDAMYSTSYIASGDEYTLHTKFLIEDFGGQTLWRTLFNDYNQPAKNFIAINRNGIRGETDINNESINVTYTINTGVWYDLTITYNSWTMDFFINWEQIGQQTWFATGNVINAIWQDIAKISSTGTWYYPIAFYGKIDDVRTYNYALSPDQIKTQYTTTITKQADVLRDINTSQSNLADGTYTYQACAEDKSGLTNCTEQRTYTVNTTKYLTVASIPTFRDRIGDYSSTGDMWIFVQSGATRTQAYNSSKNANQTGVNVWASGTGLVILSGGLLQSGDSYLAVYKPTGGLSIGYTGIRSDDLTGFDFTVTNPNLYPQMQYEGTTYTKLGDVESSSSPRWDYINEFDLTEINYKLNQKDVQNKGLYDFDGNSTTNVIEQSAIIQFDSHWWCIEEYTEVNPLPGLQKTDFYE